MFSGFVVFLVGRYNIFIIEMYIFIKYIKYLQCIILYQTQRPM